MPARKKKDEKRQAANGKKEEGSDKLATATHTIAMGLADLLKSLLNSGLVAVGDVKIKISDVEIPIKLRLLLTMIEKAKEEGINWWEADSFFSLAASEEKQKLEQEKETMKIQIEDIRKEQKKLPKGGRGRKKAKK